MKANVNDGVQLAGRNRKSRSKNDSGGLLLKAQTLSVIVGPVSCLWLADARAVDDGKADVLLRNGKLYTADPARSIRQAIAIKGNTIVAVGDDQEVAPLIGAGTTVVDLKGKLVLPGLIDTHIHPILGAVNGTKCSLAGVKATMEALTPVIRACLDKVQGGPHGMVRGGAARQLRFLGDGQGRRQDRSKEAARTVGQ